MPKRRSDATGRRFFDEFESVRVSRFRATGVIDPAKRQALIPFPGGERQKLIGTAHVRFPNGGGFSYFVCPNATSSQASCTSSMMRRAALDAAPQWPSCTAPEWASAGANASAQGTKLSTGSSRRLKPTEPLTVQASARELGR